MVSYSVYATDMQTIVDSLFMFPVLSVVIGIKQTWPSLKNHGTALVCSQEILCIASGPQLYNVI